MRTMKKFDFDSIIAQDPFVQEFLREEEERQRAHPPASNLFPYEAFWRDHQVWLQEKGYMLRPRFHPDWIPSSLSLDKGSTFEPEDTCISFVSSIWSPGHSTLLTISADGTYSRCAEYLYWTSRDVKKDTQVRPPI